MSEMLEETRKRARTLEMSIQIGIGMQQTLQEGIRNFFDVFRDWDIHNGDKNIRKFKEDLEGKRYRNEAKFILDSKRKGAFDFTDVAVQKNDIKLFSKLCKNYGIDFVLQERPANLEDLVFKYQTDPQRLSQYQKKVVEAFTYKDDPEGPLLIKQEAALITFASKDLDNVERVLDKMEEKIFSITQQRMQAEKIAAELKQKKKIDLDKKMKINKSVGKGSAL